MDFKIQGRKIKKIKINSSGRVHIAEAAGKDTPFVCIIK